FCEGILQSDNAGIVRTGGRQWHGRAPPLRSLTWGVARPSTRRLPARSPSTRMRCRRLSPTPRSWPTTGDARSTASKIPSLSAARRAKPQAPDEVCMNVVAVGLDLIELDRFRL